MTEHLVAFVTRLHAQGHSPQKIYDALITRIPKKQAKDLVHKVTGCVIGAKTRSAKPKPPLVGTRGERARQKRRKLSRALKGRTRSQETRDKISAAVKQRRAEQAMATPTRVCARAGCEALVAKATMRYCSAECQQIVRRARQVEYDKQRRMRTSKIKRYTGHHGKHTA